MLDWALQSPVIMSNGISRADMEVSWDRGAPIQTSMSHNPSSGNSQNGMPNLW